MVMTYLTFYKMRQFSNDPDLGDARFRSRYVLEGVFRELGLVTGNAQHLVFAIYSFPRENCLYRGFFQVAWAGKSATRHKT
jgi:hypothetical protein